ncbi:MAG: transposase [Clostridia bacterium]|nr:transposase [Clostridia bacterium]
MNEKNESPVSPSAEQTVPDAIHENQSNDAPDCRTEADDSIAVPEAQGFGAKAVSEGDETKELGSDKTSEFSVPDKFERKQYGRDALKKLSKYQIVDLYMEGQTAYNSLLCEYQKLSERVKRDSSIQFGSKKDTIPNDPDPDTISEEENGEPSPEKEEESVNKKNKKKKRSWTPKRSPGFSNGIDDEMPELVLEEDFTDEEKVRIFGDHKYTELPKDSFKYYEVLPARIILVTTVLHVYKDQVTGKIYRTTAARNKKVMPHSKVTPSLGGYLAVRYYSECTPVPRMLERLNAEGCPLEVQTVYEWLRKFDEMAICIVAARLQELVLTYPAIQMDETYWKCIEEALKNNGVKMCYFWVTRSSAEIKDRPQIVTATFVKRRDSKTLSRIVGDYNGTLECDGHSAYPTLAKKANDILVKLVIACCLQHVRHYFFNVLRSIPGLKKMPEQERKKIPAYNIILAIDAVFEAEWKIKGKSREERLKERLGTILPLVERAYNLIRVEAKNKNLQQGSLMDTAIKYALNRYVYVLNGVKNPDIPLHNSDTERIFAHSLSIFRNNSKAFFSADGGERAGHYFSVICTCKENNISPDMYIRFLIETIPGVVKENQDSLRKNDLSFLDPYMPWEESFKTYEEKCRAEIRMMMEMFGSKDQKERCTG